ncbi:MAG: GrpB family protein, partial [Wohlfahrtiimonas sp.]
MFKDQLTAQQKKLVCTFVDENPWVKGKPEQVHIEVVAHDPDWFARFGVQKELIQKVLGDIALSIEHVGSTAVIGLAAKPIIDIDLII